MTSITKEKNGPTDHDLVIMNTIENGRSTQRQPEGLRAGSFVRRVSEM
ncbi:hypothetical protein [Ciceribacter sp. RN22]|nr:hypothetical protein [Ciceribacter sp. RN22]MCO6180907.1 hypothetical protein [Ciceribacter sp. RN22]